MDIKRIDIAEFRRVGYLQELNRQFLHPLGLALEVVVREDGTEQLGGIWDYRDDPEGMNYGPGEDKDRMEKALRVQELWDGKAKSRQEKLGYIIQPLTDLAPSREADQM